MGRDVCLRFLALNLSMVCTSVITIGILLVVLYVLTRVAIVNIIDDKAHWLDKLAYKRHLKQRKEIDG